MISSPQNNNERINLRLRPNAKLRLELAARLKEQTLSKFILNVALLYAEKTIQEHEVMQLDKVDSEAFFDALSAPVQFNEKLTSALTEHDKKVISK